MGQSWGLLALLAYFSQDILYLPHWVNLILYGKQKKYCGYTFLPCSPATVIIGTIKVIFWSPFILYFNQSKTLHGEINNLRTHKDHRWDTEMAPGSARVSSFLVAILFFCACVHELRYVSLMPGVFLVPAWHKSQSSCWSWAHCLSYSFFVILCDL